MRRLTLYLTGSLLLWGAPNASGQTIGKRDSTVADSLTRLRPWLNGWRLTTLNTAITTLRTPVIVPVPVPIPPPTVPLPVASFEVVCAQLQCAFNANASTGTKLTDQWDCGAFPNCTPGNVSTFSFSYPHEGSRTAVLTVRDSLGRSASTTRVFMVPGIPLPDSQPPPPPPPPPPPDTIIANWTVTPAELPRSVPAFVIPSATRTYTIGTDFQRALDTAKAGDEMRLPGTYTGNFVIPAKACGTWITIRSVAEPPAAGVRVTPPTAAGFAKLVTPNSTAALQTASAGTCGWRIVGIEVTGTLPEVSEQYGLVWLGGGDETQTALAQVPQQILLDRVYVHGTPTLNIRRCVMLNSGTTVIRDSWISECHAKGADSQAIVGWNGPGPYLIENNHLEGAGENVMFGGADPGIAGMVPSDITFRRNHVIKPLVWKGGPWSVKNLFELKSAARLLVDGNVFENNWPAAQEGSAIVIKSNANGCQCTFLGTRDVTFRYNILRNAPVGFALQGWDNSYNWDGGVHTQRVALEQNLVTLIGAEGRASLMLFTHDLKDISVTRNTIVHAPTARGLALTLAYSNGAARRLLWADNVLTATAGYAIFYDGGIVHSAGLTAFASDRSWSWQRNVVGGMLPEYVALNPSASWYPSTVAAIGLAADFSLLATSPFKGKGLNGTDPGADIAELTRRVAGVVVIP